MTSTPLIPGFHTAVSPSLLGLLTSFGIGRPSLVPVNHVDPCTGVRSRTDDKITINVNFVAGSRSAVSVSVDKDCMVDHIVRKAADTAAGTGISFSGDDTVALTGNGCLIRGNQKASELPNDFSGAGKPTWHKCIHVYKRDRCGATGNDNMDIVETTDDPTLASWLANELTPRAIHCELCDYHGDGMSVCDVCDRDACGRCSKERSIPHRVCLLYTSDAADE